MGEPIAPDDYRDRLSTLLFVGAVLLPEREWHTLDNLALNSERFSFGGASPSTDLSATANSSKRRNGGSRR